MDGHHGEEEEVMVKELEGVKERLLRLKIQEQAVVDEEEALASKLHKLSKQVQDFPSARVSRLWASINNVRPFHTPLLLTVSLGRVRFVLPEKQRLRYKQDYEGFKLWSVGVQFAISCLQLVFKSVLLDALSNFHLVYYYSTLTLREHIMVANGSHIRFWWRTHHYLCVVIAGVLLIWPLGTTRQTIRAPLLYFAIYASGIQVLQYKYQMRRLYTLRALDRVGPMETTTESATVHIKNDLAFLLPFLVIGHLWQFYLARQFYLLVRVPGSTWHVPVLSLLFLMIGTGNMSAVLYTAFTKYFKK